MLFCGLIWYTIVSFRILKKSIKHGDYMGHQWDKQIRHMRVLVCFNGILREICPTIWHFDVWLKRMLQRCQAILGDPIRDPKIWCKQNMNLYGRLWKYLLWFIVISCDFLWFLVIYCDFLWFIVIYRDLVWFHENSWV